MPNRTRRKKKNRSRNDLIEQMLIAALDGASKTQIMYKAELSFSQIDKEYLPLLLQNKLLEYDSKTKQYSTTQRGASFLEKYKNLKL
ncbi:MAG TPA: winged helix-turn-helix domain-containing protein [Nitrososphaera sp.]|nr:winged helix-turn-helix domain-containing protein [Nitrososphaera sp.]